MSIRTELLSLAATGIASALLVFFALLVTWTPHPTSVVGGVQDDDDANNEFTYITLSGPGYGSASILANVTDNDVAQAQESRGHRNCSRC